MPVVRIESTRKASGEIPIDNVFVDGRGGSKAMTKTAAGLAATMTVAATSALAPAPVSWRYEDVSPENQGHLRALLGQRSTRLGRTTRSRSTPAARISAVCFASRCFRAGPDVVYTPGPAYAGALARAGQLAPLDEYAAKLSWNERVLPVFRDLGRNDGELYALPKTYETPGLLYDATPFAERGWTPRRLRLRRSQERSGFGRRMDLDPFARRRRNELM